MSDLPSNFKAHKAMSTIVAAADTAVAAIIKYIGVAVDDAQVVFGTHDLTFYTNYTTDAVKDTTIGTSGVILSDAGAADMTFAAVAALVNASANWRMLLVGARPEENFYTHSGTVQRVLASAADSANSIACRTEEGMKLYFDSTASLNTVAVMGPESLAASFAKFMNRVSRPSLFDGGFDISDYRTTAGVDVPGAAEKSAVQWTAVLTQIIETGVASDLTSTVNVYTASQTVSRLLWSRAGGATTVQTTFGDSHGLPLMSDPGERLIVQVIVAGTTPACNDLQLAGYIGELAA